MNLDLADIQGNVLTAYGKLGFPKGRVLLLHVADGAAGRAFVEALRPVVTTALRWSSGADLPTGDRPVPRPAATVNIAFTWRGLLALGTPVRTLRGMPEEFIDGMAARARVLGDDVPEYGPDTWDPVWRPGAPDVHILVLLNAQVDAQGEAVPELDTLDRHVRQLAATSAGKVTVLSGHGSVQGDAQELSAIFEDDGAGGRRPTPREHFGFVDAISDPVFHGQLPDHGARARAVGGGKLDRNGVWTPLATGEFLLGYADEAQEVAGAAMPLAFSRNGTFFAYRKLHQEIAAFEGAIDRAAPGFAAAAGVTDLDDARLLLKAKIAGRWPDGLPVERFPTPDLWRTGGTQLAAATRGPGRQGGADALNAFTYGADEDGAKCPLGAHLRRMNPRDALDPLGPKRPGGAGGTALSNRRRILRRGLPYGAAAAPDAEHGIVLMAVCASLFRQFEFVQQQWLNYGLDFNAGNAPCPLVGVHPRGTGFVVPAYEGSAPFFFDDLPPFVRMRGGDYFFVPSLTCLRMIGQGLVDPT